MMNSPIGKFLHAVEAEVERATELFPDPNGLTAAFSEEAGEVVKAVLSEPWEAVYVEAVQAAAMACRLALEGDPTLRQYRLDHMSADAGMPNS